MTARPQAITVSVRRGRALSRVQCGTVVEAIEFLLRVQVAQIGEGMHSPYAKNMARNWIEHLERITTP